MDSYFDFIPLDLFTIIMKHLQIDLSNFGKSLIVHNNYNIHINNIKEGNYQPNDIFYNFKVTQNVKNKITSKVMSDNIELLINIDNLDFYYLIIKYSISYGAYYDYDIVIGKLKTGDYIYIEIKDFMLIGTISDRPKSL